MPNHIQSIAANVNMTLFTNVYMEKCLYLRVSILKTVYNEWEIINNLTDVT